MQQATYIVTLVKKNGELEQREVTINTDVLNDNDIERLITEHVIEAARQLPDSQDFTAITKVFVLKKLLPG